jgi:hypothetical protein
LELAATNGSPVFIEAADRLAPAWVRLGSVPPQGSAQFFFDTEVPLPAERFYRASQSSAASPFALDLHLVPEITLAGAVGGTVQIEFINQFGPTTDWHPLASVTLTNTSQVYLDSSSIGQPPRLYRLSP